jgi:hypothetical protein
MIGQPGYGHVYLIQKGDADVYKIGIAKHPRRRLRALQTGTPELLRLARIWYLAEPYRVEQVLHRKFALACTRGEWFALSPAQFDAVRTYLDQHVTRRPMAILTLPLAFVLLALCLCTGCDSIAYWQMETFYHLDCRPEHLQNGKCVSTKKGDANAQQAAQPVAQP